MRYATWFVRGAILSVLVSIASAPAEATEQASLPSAAVARARPRGAAAAAAADPADREARLASAEEEKKRVPKDKDKDRETKPAGDKEARTETKEDEGGWASCIFDLIANALCSGGGESESSNPMVPTMEGQAAATASMEAARSAAVGQGVIQHPDSLQTPVQVWDGPGGAERGYLLVGALIHGTKVEVTSTRSFEIGDWVAVRTRDLEPLSGWVPAQHVDWVAANPGPLVPVTMAPGMGGPAGAGATAPGTPGSQAGGGPNWEASAPHGLALWSDLSYIYAAGPWEVRDEYRNGGGRFSVNALLVPAGSLQLSLGLGYAEARGHPQYDYETATRRDVPITSRLRMFDIGLRVGQYAQVLSSRARVYWGAGPVFYWVRESADLEAYELPSGSPLGPRHESLHRSRLGADVALGASFQIANKVHVGGLARAFVIPWYAQRSKSLPLDFIGKKSIAGFGISLILAFDAF